MTDPLPRRIAWFAPWTWKPWKRWALVAMLAVVTVGYPLSIGPAWAAQLYGIMDHKTLSTLYLPVWWLAYTNDRTESMLVSYLALWERWTGAQPPDVHIEH